MGRNRKRNQNKKFHDKKSSDNIYYATKNESKKEVILPLLNGTKYNN